MSENFKIDNEKIKEKIKCIHNELPKCRDLFSMSSDMKSKKGELLYVRIEDGTNDNIISRYTRDMNKQENNILICGMRSNIGNHILQKGIDHIATDVYPKDKWDIKKFSDDNNPYHDLLEMGSVLNKNGFEPKFILINSGNYFQMAQKIKCVSGTWIELIKKNICNNILNLNSVPSNVIYAGDIGNDIAEIFLTEDFDICNKNNKLYLIDRIFIEFYELKGRKSEAFVRMAV